MSKKTLVIGASLNPSRYSYFAVQKLKEQGHDVVALGKRKGEISGVQVETEQLPYNDLHTITLYINANNQKSLYDYILSLKPKRVIFNPGTENAEFYKILKENGISFETACTLVLLSTNQY